MKLLKNLFRPKEVVFFATFTSTDGRTNHSSISLRCKNKTPRHLYEWAVERMEETGGPCVLKDVKIIR